MANVYNSLVVQLTMGFSSASGSITASNSIYLLMINPPDASSLEDLLDVLENWIDVEWQPLANTAWSCVSLEARSLSGPTGLVVTRSVNYAGAVVSASPPANVTIAVSFRTGHAGRSMRGRNYFVGLAEEDITNSSLSSAVGASIIEAYEVFKTAFAGLDGEWVVYSRFTGGAPRATGLATPITDVIMVDFTIDSMRTRLPAH